MTNIENDEPTVTVAPPEFEAQIDEALGLVTLPPIRISQQAYDQLRQHSENSGLIIQAEVRKLLEFMLT